MEHNTKNRAVGDEVWGLFKLGDQGAFREIYNVFVDPLFAYGMKITSDREAVKDCIHDVFMDLQRFRPNLRHPEYIEFYLYRSLKNCIYHRLKKDKRFKNYPVEEMTVFDMKFDGELDGFDREYEHRQIVKLREILDNLDSQKREVLFLKFNTGLSYIEIGQMLGINPDTIKKQVYRTLDLLRKKFGSQLFELFNIYSVKARI